MNTNKNAFEDVWNWIKEKDKFSLGQSPDKYRIKEALKFHSSCMELGEELTVQPESIKALCKLFDGLDGKTMTVWDGYDTSLREANASMRSKPTRKPKTITTHSMSNVEKGSSKPKSGSREAAYSHLQLLKPSNQAKSRAAAARARAKASQEQEAVTQATSTNGSGSGRQSYKERNAYKERKERKERKNTAKKSSSPTTIETKKPSKKVYLCPSCDERFETQDKCESHIQMCSFGLVKHLKPIVKQDDTKPAKESKPTSRSSDASRSSNANDPNSKTKKNRFRKRRDRHNRNKNKGPQQGAEA